MTDTPTPCKRGCTIKDRHLTGCPDRDTCWGCFPRPAKHGRLCYGCIDNLRDNLRNIPRLIAHTAQMPAGRLASRSNDHQTSDRRITKVDQISPSSAYDESDEANHWLYQWALVLADEHRHKGPFKYRNNGVPDFTASTTMSTYLTNNIEQIAASDWVIDIYEEAAALIRRLTNVTGRDRLIHRIKERCPSCDQRSLIREDGAAKVICRNDDCARVWTESEYARLAYVAVS